MKALAIVLAVLASIALVAGSFVLYGVGVYNQANSYEQALVAEQANNKNILSNYGKKVAESVQVPAMQRDDFVKVVKAQMEGRYGPNGSGATMQWIKENNVALDSKVYTSIQRMIESGRNEFSTGQTKLISIKQEYTTVLGSVPRGFVMKLVGYPKVNLNDFNIVSDDRTDKAFETHKEEAIQLRSKD